MRKGEVGILNVGAGDTKLSFDPANKGEVERAKTVVEDMLRRGFAIMVHVGERDGKPLYHRAETFDPKTNEYIIAGLPEEHATDLPAGSRSGIRRGRKTLTTIPAPAVHARAVARSAGG